MSSQRHSEAIAATPSAMLYDATLGIKIKYPEIDDSCLVSGYANNGVWLRLTLQNGVVSQLEAQTTETTLLEQDLLDTTYLIEDNLGFGYWVSVGSKKRGKVPTYYIEPQRELDHFLANRVEGWLGNFIPFQIQKREEILLRNSHVQRASEVRSRLANGGNVFLRALGGIATTFGFRRYV